MEATTFRPAVLYGSEVTPLTFAQCQQVQLLSTRRILSAAGYNSNMPRCLVYGPRKFGGIGLMHLHTCQGIELVLTVIKHMRFNDDIARMMQIAIDSFQLTAGLPVNILHQPPDIDLSYTGAIWLLELTRFLQQHKIGITMPNTYIPHTRRQHDVLLMQAATQTMPAADWAKINACRLYLQVETLSDISTLAGHHLLPIDHLTTALPTQSSLMWPNQDKPNAATWAVWCRFTQQFTTRQNRLRTPLGNWHNTQHRIYPHYYCPTHRVIRNIIDGSTHWCQTQRRSAWITVPLQHDTDTATVPIDKHPHLAHAYWPTTALYIPQQPQTPPQYTYHATQLQDTHEYTSLQFRTEDTTQ